ncbi:helix-turn-helix transcriptional regulator [Bacillus sp. FJAT-52991]|uniref:Helix-turn-helix transcriptional regulator n=1 Tax=Bacillus kandeliae TaxID=3129297 RepID=A0ABZ2N3E6_9BACI
MFPKRLKSLRLSKKLTQQNMADLLGITRQGYGKYESAQSEPDNETLQKIADYFDVTTDYLLGRSDNPTTQTDDEKEMLEFFANPELNLFFKEMKESPEEQLEELREIWEIIKKRNKK